ncbi:hypothetical protein [Acinetobacter rudis]|uniref:Uncharacterized protein n=1 Tax=Acinetobacter rudis CIP 110305 TaxID=421052 RepID=S3N4S9_9GAMM|nr:hypothetical protein [Acinetobacter rudis]EPF74990.1 hypothetical protein F945_01361 [Acinetobacter rudis CIP 110305]
MHKKHLTLRNQITSQEVSYHQYFSSPKVLAWFDDNEKKRVVDAKLIKELDSITGINSKSTNQVNIFEINGVDHILVTFGY